MSKLSIFLSVYVLFICMSVSNAKGQNMVLYTAKTYPAASITSLEVSASGGSITVTGNATDDAVAEVYVTRGTGFDNDVIEEVNEYYTVDIGVDGGKLYAAVKPKAGIGNIFGVRFGIALMISVPEQVKSSLRTSGGSIHISDMQGQHDFSTSGGSLTVENVSGDISGRTSGGGISAVDVSGNIELSTSGGSIVLEDCRGDITLKTSGGKIEMSRMSGGIDAATSGGSITAEEIQGILHAKTSGGHINITGMDGSAAASTSGGRMNVEMITVSEYVELAGTGNIHLSLPSGNGYSLDVRASRVEVSGVDDFRGSMDNMSMKGSMGDGRLKIDVKTAQRADLTFK